MTEQLRWIEEVPATITAATDAPSRHVGPTAPILTGPGQGRRRRAGSRAATHLRPVPEPVWRLDESTRRIGRDGIAAARAALAASGSRYASEPHAA